MGKKSSGFVSAFEPLALPAPTRPTPALLLPLEDPRRLRSTFGASRPTKLDPPWRLFGALPRNPRANFLPRVRMPRCSPSGSFSRLVARRSGSGSAWVLPRASVSLATLNRSLSRGTHAVPLLLGFSPLELNAFPHVTSARSLLAVGSDALQLGLVCFVRTGFKTAPRPSLRSGACPRLISPRGDRILGSPRVSTRPALVFAHPLGFPRALRKRSFGANRKSSGLSRALGSCAQAFSQKGLKRLALLRSVRSFGGSLSRKTPHAVSVFPVAHH